MEQIKETLEEAAEYYAHNYFEMHDTNNYKALRKGFQAGAKWQAKRMYSEEDLRRAMITIIVFDRIKNSEDITQYITQLKKK
jgi:hypothetical protein